MKREKRKGHPFAAMAVAICLLLALLPTAALAAEDSNIIMLTERSYYDKILTTGTYQVTQPKTFISYSLTISGDVTLIIPEGCVLEVLGQHGYLSLGGFKGMPTVWANGPAEAGVVLPAGSTLTLRGGGTLIATGGPGYAATDGEAAFAGSFYTGFLVGENTTVLGSGTGGTGGYAAGAPGAGIGGIGAVGGYGGRGASGVKGNYTSTQSFSSLKGSNGQPGQNGGDMGTLYVLDKVKVTATAGDVEPNGGKSIGNFDASQPNGGYGAEGYAYRGKTLLYIMCASGAPGGGGGTSGFAANIGGGGAGGGGGGAGNSGGAYVGPKTLCSSFTPYSPGTGGGVVGGKGAKGAYPNVDGAVAEEPAVGGVRGQGGAGGIVYVASGASINTPTGGDRANGDGEAAKIIPLCDATFTIYQDGVADAWSNNHRVELRKGNESITMEPKAGGGYFAYLPSGGVTYKIFVDNEDTGKTFTTTAGASSLTERLDYYNVVVTLKLDGATITNKQVMLAQEGIGRHMLTLNAATQTYGTRILSGMANDTYQVFVDGNDSGKTITAAADAALRSAQVDFCTMTVNVKLESAPYPGRRVELLRDGVFAFAPTGTTGAYSVEVPVLLGADADKQYAVVVDGQATGKTVGTAAGTREATVDFSNAKITLMQDTGKWAGQTVSLTDGTTPLPATDSAGVYSVPLLSTNPTEYTVVSNGVVSDQKIQMSTNKTTATLSYYTAAVTINKDGAAWASGATCTLNQGEQVKYRMTYDSTSKTYKVSGLPVGQEYDLMVSGSNSAENVGVKISSTSKTEGPINYFTVTFDKNVGSGSAWATQIVKAGEKPGQPAAPFQGGYTFLSWQTTAAGGTDFNFSNAINANTTAYAQWVRPSAVIGQYIKCDIDGTVNGSGLYYRLPNLSVRGYPTTGKPITTIVVNLTNASLPTTQLPAGGTRAVAMDTATGNGKVTFTIPAGLSVADTETFLRNLVLAVRDKPTDHTVQITVYGATN